eukprot:gb/GECH01000454.1/.p1 GENE.gb/GECH01000454.1/~~gb/GECH01000454.1/.p1  ORF type:complete len:478 (+),score=95.11 gb/GECH01000454.1/:1-1434(+)
MVDLIKKNEASHKTLLDCMKPWQIGLLLTFFIVIGFILILVGIFTGPHPYSVNRRWTNDTQGLVYMGEIYLEHEHAQMEGINSEFYIDVQFVHENAAMESFGKDDVQLDARLYGRDSTADEWNALTSEGYTATRTLQCPQNETLCDGMLILHENFVGYSMYKVDFRFQNLGPYWREGRLGAIQSNFVYGSESYAVYSIVWRFVFLAVDLLFLLVFILALIRLRLGIKEYSLEQNWTLVLLSGLVFFNNPVYALIYASASWFFYLVNILFEITFIGLFLFALLSITHANVLDQRRLTFAKFFLPKFILIVVIWLLLVISFSYTSKLEHDDPSAVVSSDYRLNDYLRYVGLGFFAAYVVWLVYLVFKGLEKTAERRTGRVFNFFFILAFISVVLAVGGVAYILIGPTTNNAGEFLSFFVIFNMFTYAMAIAFLPIRRLNATDEYNEYDPPTDEPPKREFNVENEEIEMDNENDSENQQL